MDLDRVKRYLEKGGEGEDDKRIDGMPPRLFQRIIMQGLRGDLIEPGRVICSLKVHPRLLNASDSLHGGAIATLVDLIGAAVINTLGISMSGVSVEINVSYLDAAYAHEEIEIEAKALRVGKVIGVVSVELRKKTTGRIIAQGRHTKYFAVTSKL